MSRPRLVVAALTMIAALGTTAAPVVAAPSTASTSAKPIPATVATLRPVVLPTLGGGTAIPGAINSAGVIVGSSKTSSGDFHAVVWRDGRIEDLGTLRGGRESSEAYDINDQGTIVGSSVAADNRYHSVTWHEVTTRDPSGRRPPRRSWKITDLGVLGDGPWSQAVDINNTGTILGSYTVGQGFPAQFQGSRGYVWRDRTITTIDLQPGVAPSAINDAGQVVGIENYTISPTNEITKRPFLWHNGTGRDLGTLGGRTTQPYAINNNAQVVGQGLEKAQ
jgi:probable HAF family extracellular repeat protein